MSNFIEVDKEFRDVEALRIAVAEMGGTLLDGADGFEARGWGGRTLAADWVARLPGEYDIGFQCRGDSLVPVAAWDDLEAQSGLEMPLLLRRLEVAVAEARLTIDARAQGFRYKVREEEPGGIVRLAFEDAPPAPGPGRVVTQLA